MTDLARGGPLTDLQRDAVRSSLRYFRRAAPLHIADEESSLFPRLRATADAVDTEMTNMLAALESEHAAADADHDEVEALAGEWLAQGRLSRDDTSRLADALERLSTLYACHIRLEDTQLLPLASRLLSQEQIADIGREMAARRGLDNAFPAAGPRV